MILGRRAADWEPARIAERLAWPLHGVREAEGIDLTGGPALLVVGSDACAGVSGVRGRPRGEGDAQHVLGHRGGRRGGAGLSAGLPGLVREGKEWGAGPRWAAFWFLVSFSFSSSFLFPFLFQTNSN